MVKKIVSLFYSLAGYRSIQWCRQSHVSIWMGPWVKMLCDSQRQRGKNSWKSYAPRRTALEGILLCQKATLKKLHAVWFRSCNIFWNKQTNKQKPQNYRDREQHISACQGLQMGWGAGQGYRNAAQGSSEVTQGFCITLYADKAMVLAGIYTWENCTELSTRTRTHTRGNRNKLREL